MSGHVVATTQEPDIGAIVVLSIAINVVTMSDESAALFAGLRGI